jgi:hypothetical protein
LVVTAEFLYKEFQRTAQSAGGVPEAV